MQSETLRSGADLVRDQDAFQREIEPFRREVQAHCYRMLGSLQDAEDVTQETFLRAWRGWGSFEGRSSLRSWLYRIATNACLTALTKRASNHRVMPAFQSPPAELPIPPGPPPDAPWLEPYPDLLLEGIADDALGPDARYELRESVQLAFVVAIQTLPPRQRVALLLRDVLGWSAAETAGLLDTSVASANSALQRARATLGKQFPGGESGFLSAPDDEQQALLNRYVQAWESADVDGFIALLRDDAFVTMPPIPYWYMGHETLRRFMAWAWGRDGGAYGRAPRAFLLKPTAANGQPAFAMYQCIEGETAWKAHSINVLALQGRQVTATHVFLVPALFSAFGQPMSLPLDAATEAIHASLG